MNISSEQKELIHKLMRMKHLFLIINSQIRFGEYRPYRPYCPKSRVKNNTPKCQLTLQILFLVQHIKMKADVCARCVTLAENEEKSYNLLQDLRKVFRCSDNMSILIGNIREFTGPYRPVYQVLMISLALYMIFD